jgi:hypothetical protein
MYEIIEIHAGHKAIIDATNTLKKAIILQRIYQMVCDSVSRIVVKKRY